MEEKLSEHKLKMNQGQKGFKKPSEVFLRNWNNNNTILEIASKTSQQLQQN